MLRFIKSTAILAALLFTAQSVQAALIPTDISEDFGLFTAAGTVDSAIYSLPAADPPAEGDEPPFPTVNPAVNWYRFTLGTNLIGLATVTLDTELLYDTYPYDESGTIDSSTANIDTVLALYDAGGSLILNSDGENQNDDCPEFSRYSCSTFSLGAGTYIAGVNDAQFMLSFAPFLPDWMLEKRDYDDVSFTALSIEVGGDFGPVSVPEPATLWLLGIGLFGLIGVARRTQVQS